jgi:hypothetical protein
MHIRQRLMLPNVWTHGGGVSGVGGGGTWVAFMFDDSKNEF